MNNRTKLTIVAAFIVAGIIVGATIGSIPSVAFAQTSGNSTSSAGGGASSGNSTSGGSANSTGTTGSNSTSG
jgi:gas vesicle protein